MTIFDIAAEEGRFVVPAEAMDYMETRYPKDEVDVHLRNGKVLRSCWVTTIETLANTSPLKAVRVWWTSDYDFGSGFRVEPILAWQIRGCEQDPDFPSYAAPLLGDYCELVGRNNETVGILDPNAGRITSDLGDFESVEEFAERARDYIREQRQRLAVVKT